MFPLSSHAIFAFSITFSNLLYSLYCNNLGNFISSISRSVTDHIRTILLTSTKWFPITLPLFSHAIFALSITLAKFLLCFHLCDGSSIQDFLFCSIFQLSQLLAGISSTVSMNRYFNLAVDCIQ